MGLIDTLSGAAITLVVSFFFYMRAANDLKKETKELRGLIKLTIKALDESDLVEFVRDQSGQISGITVKGRSQMSAASSISIPDKVADDLSENK